MAENSSNCLNDGDRQSPIIPNGGVRLFLCCAAIGFVWLVVLPAIARTPQMREQTEFLESRGIDPGAMFYTELDAMGPILQEMDAAKREHPYALWVPAEVSTTSTE